METRLEHGLQQLRWNHRNFNARLNGGRIGSRVKAAPLVLPNARGKRFQFRSNHTFRVVLFLFPSSFFRSLPLPPLIPRTLRAEGNQHATLPRHATPRRHTPNTPHTPFKCIAMKVKAPVDTLDRCNPTQCVGEGGKEGGGIPHTCFHARTSPAQRLLRHNAQSWHVLRKSTQVNIPK